MERIDQNLRVDTNHPVAVFDLDGVLSVSPSPEPINDVSFFDKIWGDYRALDCNPEMVTLLRTLANSGWAIVILTGRPSTYRKETFLWLDRFGIRWRTGWAVHSRDAILITRSIDDGEDISSSSEWKLRVLRMLQARGANIALIIEDYKPNADVLRQVAPVLLYEMKRPPSSKLS